MSNHTSTVAAILCQGACESTTCTDLATHMKGKDEHMVLTRMERFRQMNITDRNAFAASL